MEKVLDHKGLTISYWNRYLKQFNEFLSKSDLLADLNQEIELIALETRHIRNVKKAGKEIAKRLRQFLKSYGFKKQNGRWIIRDLLR